jgi:hypothetical protein
VVVIAPEKLSALLQSQVETFKRDVLKSEFHRALNITSYEKLVELLSASSAVESNRLGGFLAERLMRIAVTN